MPEQIRGVVEIRTTEDLTTITIDGGAARVCVGGDGRSGVVAVYGESGEERVRLESGRVFVSDAGGRETVRLLGLTRKLVVRDASGAAVLRLERDESGLHIGSEGAGGQLHVYHAPRGESQPTPGGERRLDLGTQERSGELHVHDGARRSSVVIDGHQASVHLGTTNNAGQLLIYDSGGTRTITLDGEAGDVVLEGGDCAERFEVLEAGQLEPGTVMVIDAEGRLRQSSTAYDTKVAGVLSGAGSLRPGLVLGGQARPATMPLALTGRVYCRVDADRGPIEIGDLLTTSSTPGHAMKVADPTRALGAILGKAMGSHARGRGLIPVLVALQ